MPAAALLKARGRGLPKLWRGSTTGPASYSTGGFTVTISELSKVDFAVVQATGGYKPEIAGISGNTITILVRQYDYPATAAGPAVEVGAGTDLSGVTFYILAFGE